MFFGTMIYLRSTALAQEHLSNSGAGAEKIARNGPENGQSGQIWLKKSPEGVNRLKMFFTFCCLHFFSTIALNGTYFFTLIYPSGLHIDNEICPFIQMPAFCLTRMSIQYSFE